MLLQTVADAMFGAVIASTLYMALNLALTVYMQTAICAFYDAYHSRASQETPADNDMA